MPRIEAWVRGRFVDVPGATAERLASNTWTVRIPTDDATRKALRMKRLDLSTAEDLVLAIDEAEARQVVASKEGRGWVEVVAVL